RNERWASSRSSEKPGGMTGVAAATRLRSVPVFARSPARILARLSREFRYVCDVVRGDRRRRGRPVIANSLPKQLRPFEPRNRNPTESTPVAVLLRSAGITAIQLEGSVTQAHHAILAVGFEHRVTSVQQEV